MGYEKEIAEYNIDYGPSFQQAHSQTVICKELMKTEVIYKDIEDFFNHPNDWNNDLVEDKKLSLSDKAKSIEYIITKLNSNDTAVRYIASHMILTFKIEEAKQKLIERILNKDTYNSNGTMTYALYHLNCKSNLVDVFKILATQSYESKMHAYSILSEQEFEFSEEDLNQISLIWKKVKSNQELEKETFDMIEDAYKGFISYMDN